MREDDFRETARFTSAGEPAREEAAVLQRGFRETVGLDALGSSLAPPEVRKDGGVVEYEGIYY